MASIPCPSSCTPADLLAIPAGNCVSDFRRDTPSRLFMYNCDIDLPTGSFDAVGAAMATLFAAGSIVSTSPLANLVFEDPTYEELQISDCNTPQSLIATRAMTFEDRTGINISGISPFVLNKYFDYDFWLDKITNQNNIRYMLAYCSGDVRPIDLLGTLRGYLNYLKAQQAGGKSTETKVFRILFQGDPLDFSIKPTFNYISAGIQL